MDVSATHKVNTLACLSNKRFFHSCQVESNKQSCPGAENFERGFPTGKFASTRRPLRALAWLQLPGRDLTLQNPRFGACNLRPGETDWSRAPEVTYARDRKDMVKGDADDSCKRILHISRMLQTAGFPEDSSNFLNSPNLTAIPRRGRPQMTGNYWVEARVCLGDVKRIQYSAFGLWVIGNKI